MSNTAEVTPYVEEPPASDSHVVSAAAGIVVAGTVAAVSAAVVGAVAVARWLSEETEADVQATARLRARRREELRAVKSCSLAIHDASGVAEAAARLGYRMDQQATRNHESDTLLLRRDDGARLAIEQSTRGSLTLRAAGGEARMHELVREYAFEQAVRHLSARGMEVRVARLANGDCQVSARERQPGKGGAAQVKAHVRNDGTAWLDVDCLKGARCEDLIGDLAQAMGSRVVQRARKDSVYQLPGEAVKPKVKV